MGLNIKDYSVVFRDGAEQLLAVYILQCCSNLSALSHSTTNILGVFMGPLSMKELDQIENQTKISVKHIRSRKVENLLHKNKVFLDELFDLRNKVMMNQELRTILTLDSMLLLLLLFI